MGSLMRTFVIMLYTIMIIGIAISILIVVDEGLQTDDTVYLKLSTAFYACGFVGGITLLLVSYEMYKYIYT